MASFPHLSTFLYIHLGLTLSRLLYYIIGISLLISQWNKPFLKA